MSVYVEDHASALADVQAAGTAVTFTRRNPGTHTATTGRFSTPTTPTVSGYAMEDDSDPEVLRALSLVPNEALTLFFVPSTIGALPNLLDEVTWNSSTYRARSIKRLAPDGTAIAAWVVVSA